VTLRPNVQIDPDVGIPDLIRRLSDDSKRLASDEVRLAKLEVGENIRVGARGTLNLAVAFGAGVVALVGLTIGLSALIGRVIGFNYWLGAMVTGLLELGAAFFLFKRGIASFRSPSYTLRETRESLKDTTSWVAAQRGD
jgi:hypothetical protein